MILFKRFMYRVAITVPFMIVGLGGLFWLEMKGIVPTGSWIGPTLGGLVGALSSIIVGFITASRKGKNEAK
jgi:hypothetical protein